VESQPAGENSVARSLSAILALVLVGFMFYLAYIILLSNVSNVTKDIDGYTRQIDNIVEFAKRTICNPDYINQLPIPDAVKKFILSYIQKHNMSGLHFTQELVSFGKAWLTGLPAGLQDMATGLVFFSLYAVFLLLLPIHIRGMTITQSNTDDVELQAHLVKVMSAYFQVKSLSNFIFATSVYILLVNLGIGLPMIIAIISFVLAFIPEIGAIVSMALPVPLIFIAPPRDEHGVEIGNATNPFPDMERRLTVLVYFVIFMLLIKMLVSNMLESYMISKNLVLVGAIEGPNETPFAKLYKNISKKDWCNCKFTDLCGLNLKKWSSWKKKPNADVEDIQELHPVIILFAVVIWGQIWGSIGMLISVPMVSFFVVLLRVWEKKVQLEDMTFVPAGNTY